MGAIEPFGGTESFKAGPEAVYAALTDLDALAETIPDKVSSERVDDRTVKAVVRPGFSFLRGTMRLTVEMDKTDASREAVMRTSAEGIGLGMKVEAKMKVEAEGSGSKVGWTAQVTEMRGLIAAVGPTLIKAAADKTVRDGWAQLRRRVDG